MNKKARLIDKGVDKGITLIALVITIIVLIILAAISINMTFGSNGLITRAQEAKLQQKIADLQEMLDMEKMENLIDKEGHITIEDYLDHLKEEGIIGEENIQDTDNEDQKYITLEDEYVFLVKDKNDGDVEIIYQGTVDHLKPTLQIEITNVTTNSITVKATASLMKNGEYKYYIKNITNGEEEYTLMETTKDDEYTFIDLTQNNQYRIKVEATNNNGTAVKESGIIITTTIEDIEEQDITFTYEPDGWTNGNVVVTADMSKITIPEGAKVQTSKDAKNWEDGNSQTFSTNGEIYVRIYDGTNESNYAVAQVSKIDKTKPVVNTATATQTAVTIGATDEASGIIGYAVTTSNSAPSSFTAINNTKNLSTTVSGLTAGTTYYVWVKDEAGNVSVGKSVTTSKYTVTYYIDSGNTKTQQFKTGESVISGLNFTPSKSGYTFVGWREDTTASSSVLSSKTMGNSSIKLYAVFKQNITVTKYNGSSSATTETKTKYYNNGNVVNPSFTLSQKALSGWTAAGWTTSTSATGSTAVNNGGSVTLSSNATYYGKYTQTITLSYSGNGNTGGSTASQSGTRYYNSAGNYSNPSFTLRSNGFTKTNYSFVNWAMESASGTKYNAGAKVTLSTNTTFYATWKATYTTSTLSIWGGGNYTYSDGIVPFLSAPKHNTSDVSVDYSLSGNAIALNAGSAASVKAQTNCSIKINGTINFVGTDGAGAWYTWRIFIYKNGALYSTIIDGGNTSGAGYEVKNRSINTTISCNAGDTVAVMIQGGNSGTSDRTSFYTTDGSSITFTATPT